MFVKIKNIVIILAVLLLPLNLFAENQENKDLKLFMGKWIENCSSDSKTNKKKCSLERSVFIDQKMKKKIVTIIMQTESSSKDVRFILISPLGTLIQSGVKIGFDGKLVGESAFGFNICEKIGCITSMMVKKETLDLFRKSTDLNLEYIGAKGQKIQIKFSLDGFSKEFKKITKIQ